MICNIINIPKRLNSFEPKYLNFCKNVYATKAKAAKKQASEPKSEPTSSSAEEEHLFNIYASIPEDHTLLPDEAYPSWLWQLEKPDKSYGELVQTFVHGKGIEDATMADYSRFIRLHNRYQIKLNNIRLQKRSRLSFNSHLWDV